MNGNTLLNRLIRGDEDRARFFHTSGYARAANGGAIGAAGGSAEAFSARQALEENRRYIKKYNNARAVNDGNALQRVSGTVLTGGAAARERLVHGEHLTESTRERLARQAQERLFSGHNGFHDTNGDGFGGAHSVLLPQ